MTSLSKIYSVEVNLRGIAKQGHCRPTIAELFMSNKDYLYGWCSSQPITNNLDEFLYDNNDVIVLI